MRGQITVFLLSDALTISNSYHLGVDELWQ